MRKETVVTIVSDDKPKEETKYPVRPSKRSKGLARRLSFPAIQFYDLAQVNTGTTESPVYTDYPILKVPGYSISPALASGNFVGAQYTIDPFTQSDYQAYTDMMFAVAPVTEWKHKFKKMEALSEPFQFETLRVRKVPQTGLINTELITNTYADITTVPGRANRAAFLSNIGFSWTSRGLEYRNFTELTTRSNADEWFTLSTGIKDTYYITSVYDPNASDVGALTIRGNIDVYLMPHIGLFLGASYDGPHVLTGYLGQNGVQVLGPWYQVAPRIDFPAAAIFNPETLTFIDYQRNRADAQASEWFHDGGATTTLTSSTIDPTVFAVGNFTFVTGMLNNGVPVFYNTTAGVFYQSSIGGNDFFVNADPFLMAVLKIHGVFYYVWCVPGYVISETLGFSGYDITEYVPGIDGQPF